MAITDQIKTLIETARSEGFTAGKAEGLAEGTAAAEASILAELSGTPVVAPKPTRKPAVEAKKERNTDGIPKRCKFPGCRKKHKGPRFRFLCEEHMGTTKEQLEALLNPPPAPKKNGVSATA